MDYYNELKKIMEKDGEDFSKKICTISDEELKNDFEDMPFTAWGKKWVYFPLYYDGIEWIGHAPRNPCNISMERQGGG